MLIAVDMSCTRPTHDFISIVLGPLFETYGGRIGALVACLVAKMFSTIDS